jgi:hypothetical protein
VRNPTASLLVVASARRVGLAASAFAAAVALAVAPLPAWGWTVLRIFLQF